MKTTILNLELAKTLKKGDTVIDTVFLNKNGTPKTYKVWGVKTWKKNADKIFIRFRHGYCEWADADENTLGGLYFVTEK